jgi:uncharacterized protein (TIGR02001 family)
VESKKLVQKLMLAVAALSGVAYAQTTAAPAPAPAPASSLSFNIGAVTEYRYRGISQSAREPALQGGVDYAAASGWYVGSWASTIKWIKDSSFGTAQAKGPVEIDLYGGYKGNITDTVSFDVGGLEYWYAGNTYKNITGVNANTFELYAAISYELVTLKWSRSITNLFGTANSKGSDYLDASLNLDFGNGWTAVPHLGYQHVAHNYQYMDYSLTVAKDLGNGLSASLAAIGATKRGFFVLPGSGTKDLGRPMLVAGIKKTF